MRRSHISDSSYGSQSQQRTDEVLEDENNVLEDSLKDKVKALKSLSIDIGTEVRDQNNFLKRMDDDFDGSGNLLRSTMSRVQALARAGHNRYILYLFLFALFVFFVCWVIIKVR